MKLRDLLNESNWQNRQYCLGLDKKMRLPTEMDCFYFTVAGANCHFFEVQGDKLTYVKNKAYLDLYAIANFKMLWENWEFFPGRVFSEIKPILEILDI